MTSALEERYFYHSFPRRGHSTDSEIAKGVEILTLIVDAGLVLAPEIVEWRYPHANGKPPRTAATVQRRVCFTELAPSELLFHAEKFGRFALEFDVDTLKRLGAMPVFYVPRLDRGDGGAPNAGDVLVMQTIDAMQLVNRIDALQAALRSAPPEMERLLVSMGFSETGHQERDLSAKETLATIEVLMHGITPSEMLGHGLEAVLGLFYPADDARNDKALDYYRQREWRIASNIAIRGEEMMRRPSAEFIRRLMGINAEFWGRKLSPESNATLAESTMILPGLEGAKLRHLVRRVVVPQAAVLQAETALSQFDGAPTVVALESLGVE